MTLEELKQKMIEVEESSDWNWHDVHEKQDELLLEYIGDEEIKQIYNSTQKWYS